MNLFWVIMAWVTLAIVIYFNNGLSPKKVWASLKKHAGHEFKIALISSLALLTLIVGWIQTGFDPLLLYIASIWNGAFGLEFSYTDQQFFPQGKINFLIVIIAGLMQYFVNGVYKRYFKPNEKDKVNGS